MSARVVIDLLPSGKPGNVYIQVSSEVSDGGSLTPAEVEFTLEQVLDGLRSGSITLLEPTTVILPDPETLHQASDRWTAPREGM